MPREVFNKTRPTVKVTINGQVFDIAGCHYNIWPNKLSLEGTVSSECIRVIRDIWQGNSDSRDCDFDIDYIASHKMRIQFDHVKGHQVAGQYSVSMQASLRRKDGTS